MLTVRRSHSTSSARPCSIGLEGKAIKNSSGVLYIDACFTRLNKEKEKLDTDLSASVLLEQRLKEEVGTTRSNYEGQLSVMSDHLASMNIRSDSCY